MDALGAISLRRRVTISRLDLRVSRIEAFGVDGRVTFDATYGSYLGPAADAYPGRIEVRRPWEELVFRFEIEETRPNPTLPPGVFTLEPVEGYRTMTIEEAMAEIRNQGGGGDPEPDGGPADASSP
jgi:hypothetical protein